MKPPKPAEPKVHALSDSDKLTFARLQIRMSNANQQMTQLQNQAQKIQAEEQSIQAEWEKELAEVRKEAKCPTCTLNQDSDLVEPESPKPAEKPAEKAPEKK